MSGGGQSSVTVRAPGVSAIGSIQLATDEARWVMVIRREAQAHGSALEPGGGDPPDEVALEENEHDDHRDQGDDRGGEDLSPFGEMLGLEEGDGDRKRAAGGLLDGDMRPGEFVPTIEEGEDGDDRQAGPGEGKNDPAEDRPVAGPVDPRRA